MDGFAQVWKRSKGVFLTVFAFAAFLPMLLAGALNPNQLRLLSKADETTQLRIWMEPSTIIIKPGQPFTFVVFGEYNDKYKVVPQVEALANANLGLTLASPYISYNQPFSGKVRLGVIKGVGTDVGRYTIEIPATQVKTLMPDLPVVTSQAEVVVY